jgi:sugar phosphate isomerase/epimerase
VLNQFLSLSLAGLAASDHSSDPRAAVQWAAALGYRAVQLDASAPGIRPRELDRSGRRDLAALLRRLELSFSGLDLWIPPAHFADPAQADRALAATSAALELAADLSRLVAGDGSRVSVTLPEKATPALVESIASAADRVGARIADHQWPLRSGGDGPLGIGIDAATLLAAGADPAAEVSRLPGIPASARFSDFAPGGRVAVGEGRLDVLAYRVALATKGYMRSMVVDLRGVRNQETAASHTLRLAAGN